MKLSVQAMRGSAENTIFPYVDFMYRKLFKHMKESLGWEIEFNSRPSTKEEFGDPHGHHHTILRFEGCKPIVIDERETSYINPVFNEFDAWFIIKYAYRDHPDFYTCKGLGIDNDQRSEGLGGCRHEVVPWLGHAWEFGRWPTKPCKEWISHFDNDIDLIFTGTDRVNRDTGVRRSAICHTIQRYFPPKSYIGLHAVPFSATRNVISDHYSDLINKLLTQDYIEKLAKSRIGLSLPGLGLACYREHEYFAQCVPCIAPRFEIKYSDPLIPGVHYVAFDLSEPASFQAAYEQLQNRDFYNEISYNAWTWWNKNSNPDNPQGLLDCFIACCCQSSSFKAFYEQLR